MKDKRVGREIEKLSVVEGFIYGEPTEPYLYIRYDTVDSDGNGKVALFRVKLEEVRERTLFEPRK